MDRPSSDEKGKAQSNITEHVRQQAWTEAFDNRSADAFAETLAHDVVLEASILMRPVEGIDQVKTVMAAGSQMYEALTFTREATNGPHTYLEWEGRGPDGIQLLGVTVLTKNAHGEIARIAIHHRPLSGVLRFSAELGERVRGKVEASHFLAGQYLIGRSQMATGMVRRTDVEFEADGGVILRGWLFVPSGGTGPYPAITMAHGYAGVKEFGIESFAQSFAENGFVVLLHDHRSFGASDGEPRQDIDPWRQIADWRRAITYLESLDVVDSKRIGVWGTSYAGGHAIVLGATDRRVRCVVAQVPTISGYAQGLRRIPPEGTVSIEEMFAEDERAQFRREPLKRQAVVSADPNTPASYRTKDAIDFYLQPIPEGTWENSVTVRSTRAARMYEPGTWISRISPTPLLMVVALRDTITLTDLALDAYERALQPKRLVTIEGGHFDPYLSQFKESSAAALGWFDKHLAGWRVSVASSQP